MNSYQAKNGFKTFVITLSLALVIFSSLYYLVTGSSSNVNIEDDLESSNELAQAESKPSVFEDISKESAANTLPVVLAGADSTETTETTTAVPDTGTAGITYALFASTALLAFGAFVVGRGPRKLALSSFEERVIKTLN